MKDARMDMQIDSQRIRTERNQRAWSQEHLAKLTGLGLRTIQRIETSSAASHESISAIASVLSIAVEELVVERADRPSSFIENMAVHRLWLILCLGFIAMIFSPPQLTLQFTILWILLVGFETLAILRRKIKVV